MSQIVAFPHLPWTDKESLKPALSDYEVPQIQIIKYMGNKRALLGWLLPIISEDLSWGDTILDLFAGTSSVGYALKPKAKVITNDIQTYSSVISTALLQFNGRITLGNFNKKIRTYYERNLKYLISIFGDAVQAEEKIIVSLDSVGYKKYCEYIPRYGFSVKEDIFNLNSYSSEEYVSRKRGSINTMPYILFSVYYPNTFFSLKQCIDIDSLRFAIEQISDDAEKAVYLSCLIYAISSSVNSSGHFAEYLNHNSDKASQFILEKHSTSIIKHFLSKLSEFSSLCVQKNWKNEVYNHDYKDLIYYLDKTKKLNQVKLIYIDPPYTPAQYSRFYHIPETLVRYDYPNVTLNPLTMIPVKGGYRNDRMQSAFCQISKVEQAFLEMFDIISSRSDANLAISYSDNSIIKPIDRVIELAKKYYETVNAKNGYSHSAQGSRFKHNGQGRHLVNEYIVICKKKKRA